jgi:hypothetical protein
LNPFSDYTTSPPFDAGPIEIAAAKTDRKMRVLIVGALLLTSLLSADALACKLCLDVRREESGSSTAGDGSVLRAGATWVATES